MTVMLAPSSRLVLNVFRAQQAISLDGDRLAAADGLTSAQWKVLGAIVLAEQPPSAAAIGRAMGLSRQAVQKQIYRLLENGLIDSAVNFQDARAPVFVVTNKGENAYASVSERWQARAAVLFAGIDAADLDRASVLLETLLGRLDSGTGEDA